MHSKRKKWGKKSKKRGKERKRKVQCRPELSEPKYTCDTRCMCQKRRVNCIRLDASVRRLSWWADACEHEMRQCALRLISMYDLTLCVEVLCVGEWSTSLKLVDWPGASCRKFRCKMPTATFATCSLITYFTNRGNSTVLHNQNQAEVTIMWKKTSLTKLSWVWVEGTSQHDNQHQKSNLRLARAHVNKIFLVMTKFASIRLSAKKKV